MNDEEGKRVTISLNINPRVIERIIYWIIILVLAALLVMSYLDDGTPSTGTKNTNSDGQVLVPAPTPDPTPIPTPTPQDDEASCGDGIKNQDETDVDCGGSCTGCAAGKTCTTVDDCAAQYCVANKCTNSAPTQLSGKVEFTLTNVGFSKSGSGTVKITGITYKLTNGMDEDLTSPLVRVYVKNKGGTRCLNQQSTGTCDDSYAEFTLSTVRTGKSAEDQHEFGDADYTTMMGRYLIEDTGYDPADPKDDDFSVFVYLYDTSGDEIESKTISSFKTMNPT